MMTRKAKKMKKATKMTKRKRMERTLKKKVFTDSSLSISPDRHFTQLLILIDSPSSRQEA